MRRAEVIDVDRRLQPLVDQMVAFVTDGGKRLRPEFLWCGWIAVEPAGAGGDEGSIYQLACALELLQAFALIHDDVIDRSDQRRGRPSTHRAIAGRHADARWAGDSDHYGVSIAVLLGDLALAWADDQFTAAAQALGALDRALPVWRAMRTEVLAGQLLDVTAAVHESGDPAAQASDAMRINRYKTAAYTVERPLQLGSVVADGSAETVAALRRYGADVGVAFQLRDDLLGVFGDPRVTGKPAGGDLIEGKRTLLLANARAALADQPRLLSNLDAGVGSAAADVSELADVIARTGAPERLERRIDELVTSAVQALDRRSADGRPAVTDAARARLTELASAATDRRQ